MSNKGTKINVVKNITNNYNTGETPKGFDVVGFTSSVLTIIAFLGISKIEYMQKLLIEYYFLIPLLTLIMGASSYWFTVSFMVFSRKFIEHGIRSAGKTSKEVECIGQKYCAIVFFIGLWLIIFGLINPLILKNTLFNYPYIVYYACQYLNIALIFILAVIFSILYLFKGLYWGSCIGKFPKAIILLYITWGIAFVALLLLNLYA